MSQKKFLVAVCLMAATTSFFCAGQVAPSGGAQDRIPPAIIETYPAIGATHFNDNRISLAFSKYVDRRSVEESIFISPVVGKLTFEWGSTDVEILLSDTLRSNTTYVLTIGTDVIDRRERNRMAKAFALPFSTGEKIDTGLIAGRIFDPKPEGVMIYAYQLNDRIPDTLNPTHTQPDYLTQTGSDGVFTLPYLSIGKYRVVAIRDEFKNLLYDRQTDQYGVWISDVTLTDSLPVVQGLRFKMASEDTTAPFLSSAKALDGTHILLRFSEKMFNPGHVAISLLDTLTNKALQVYDFSFLSPALTEAQVATSRQDSGAVYRVVLEGLEDVFHNTVRLNTGGAVFSASNLTDTLKPFIQVVSITDSMKNVPIDDTVHFVFSELIQRKPFESSFQLRDSAEQNVAGEFIWTGSMNALFLPSRTFLWNSWYTIAVHLDSLQDFSGNHGIDSLWSRQFRTISERSMGSMNGTVTDERPDGTGKIYVTATEISGNNPKQQRLVLEKPGPYEFERLFEGKYSLFAFRDADSNGVYSYGSIAPFEPSERFVVYPETVKVRARWPLEGVMIRFK